MAINGIQDAGSDYEDMFNSGVDNYPWFAIDLGFLYKVFSQVYFHINVTHNLFISAFEGDRGVNGRTHGLLR